MKPRLLILDEASAMLDPLGRKSLMEQCKKLHKAGLSIVLITHFMEQASQAERLIVFDKGRIVLDGPPEEIFLNVDTLRTLSLEAPFPLQMSEALQKEGLKLKPQLTEEALLGETLHVLRNAIHVKDEDADAKASGFAGKPNKSTSNDADTQVEDPATDDVKSMKPLISFKDLSFSYEAKPKKHYKGAKLVLKNISLDIFPGEFLGIAGHTGSGKSTLIQLTNGLLQASSGQVFVRGMNLAQKQARIMARHLIGLVFQYPERQLFASSVYDDVAFGPRNLGLNAQEIDSRVQKSLELVHLNLNEIKDRSPFTLSGGQQRRVAIAGVLAMNPQVLVLDEPTAGLDPLAHRRLLELIKSLHKQGITIILVSHNMNDLASYCTRLVVLSNGTCIANDSPARVFKQVEVLEKAQLELPSTIGFAQKLGIELDATKIPSVNELAKLIANSVDSPVSESTLRLIMP